MLGIFLPKSQKTGEVLYIIVVVIGMMVTAAIAIKVAKLACGKDKVIIPGAVYKSKRVLIGRK